MEMLKSCLVKARKADEIIESDSKGIERAREIAGNLSQSVVKFSSDDVKENNQQKRLHRMLDIISDLEEEITHYTTFKHKIEQLIKQLDDSTERQVIKMSYVHDEDMRDIAEKLDISLSRLYEIRTESVKKLEVLLNAPQNRDIKTYFERDYEKDIK